MVVSPVHYHKNRDAPWGDVDKFHFFYLTNLCLKFSFLKTVYKQFRRNFCPILLARKAILHAQGRRKIGYANLSPLWVQTIKSSQVTDWCCQIFLKEMWLFFQTFLFHTQINDWYMLTKSALSSMLQDFVDDLSTLIQVMACCRQATSLYLKLCWPISMTTYTRD